MRKPRFEQLDSRLCLAFGDVDPSFADDGRFEDSFMVANRPDYVAGMIEESDPTQLIVESIQTGSGFAIGFSKLDQTGQLVGDFGDGGQIEWFDRDHAESLANAFRISNGNIVVRTTHENNSSFAAFDPDGQLDPNFGDQGILRLGGGLRWDSIPHPDGGFILLERDNQESVLKRFTNAGVLESGFGINGVVRLPAVIQPQVTIDPAGRILLFGSRLQANTSYSVIVRLLADGSPDESFAEGGVRSTEAPYLQRMYMAPSGNAYFTVLTEDDATHRTYTIDKYTSEMLRDESFGDSGSSQFQILRGRYPLNLFVLPASDGSLLIEQTWRETRGSRIVLAQFTSDGVLNSSFGDAGIVEQTLNENVFSRGLQTDAAGNQYWLGDYQPEINANWKSDGLMVRFTPAGVLDGSWANAGRRGMDHTVGTQMIDSIELATTQRGSPLIATGWRGYDTQAWGTGRVHVGNAAGTILTADIGSPELRRPAVIGAADGGWYTIGASGSKPYFIEIQRFHADASQDTSFGQDGVISVESPYPHDLFARLDDTGAVTIVASDYESSADPSQGIGVAVVVRLTATGQLDTRFAEAGVLRLYSKPAAVLDVMVAPMRGIVLVYRNTILQALDFRGQPVSGFGTNGIAMPEGVYREEWVTGEMDETGNILGIVRLYFSDLTQGYRLVKLDASGRLEPTFGEDGTVALPWEWNTAFDSPEMAIRSGTILLANSHGRHTSRVRLLAYDYNGQALEMLGAQGIRDYEFAPNGEKVTGLEFADDGSIWLSLKERRGFNETAAVYRLFGSDRGQLHNWYVPLDVNRDYVISPIDVLLVVNQLNDGVWDQVSLPDVNNDDSISPLDALLIVNYLNQSGLESAESEPTLANDGLDVSWLLDEEEEIWIRNLRQL